jgi:hypothetical protein
MALDIKTKVERNSGGTELYIEFRVATGDYNVTTNPGGFGTPNPARNAVAVLIYGLHELTDAEIPIEPLVYDPLSVSSFTIPIVEARNGVMSYNIFAVPIFDDMAVYANGDVVYDDTTTPSAPFLKERVAGVWETRTVDQLIGNDVVVQLNDYAFVTPQIEKFINYLNSQRQLALMNKVAKKMPQDEYNRIRENYEIGDSTFQTANASFQNQAYSEAQRRIDFIFNLKNKVFPAQ